MNPNENRKQIINECINYIIERMENSEEEFSVEQIAEQFHFSKYYFNRMFREETGESVYAFVKRRKLDQSAIDIKLEKDRTITEIGSSYGYSSSNYSSAFSSHHQISPARFRENTDTGDLRSPFFPEESEVAKTFEEYEAEIQIQDIQDSFVLYERVIGNYLELGEKWSSFLKKYWEQIGSETVMIERFYNDPAVTGQSHCICDLCITVSPSCLEKNTTVIPGGRFAVYRFEGAVRDIYYALQGVFFVWLPESGYHMDGLCAMNRYLRMDNEQGFVSMELCIPIK